MPYPYTLLPDGHTLEPEDVVKPPAETPAESTLTQSPHLDFGNPPPPPSPEPVSGPPAFDTGPSPYFTQEATRYAQPPSSEEEAKRRTQRIEKLRERWEKARQRATTVSPPPVIDEIPDFAELGFIDSELLPATIAPDWPGSRPLTAGQEMHVDHLLSVETNILAREVLIGLKREGMPSEAYVSDFVSQFAEWGWDDLSGALALQVIGVVRNSDWDETFAQADSAPVETIAQDLANDWIEGVVIIDAGSGNIVLSKTGVVGPDGQQYVGLQDTDVEDLKGLPLIFVHNHTKNVGASDDDLRSAFEADANLLIVITRSGREQVYIRGRDRMVLVRDEKASYEVGSSTLDEALYLLAESQAQARVFEDDPPEHLFLQEEQFVVLRGNGDLRVYEDAEAVLRGDDDASNVWSLSTYSLGFRVLDQNPSRPYLVKIDVAGNGYWIDVRDAAVELEFHRVDFASMHVSQTWYESQTAQVSGQNYDNTSLDFLNALTEALNPQAIGEIPRWDELERFVNTDLAELQRRAIENPEIIGENVALLEDIFGYDVKFWNGEFYIGEGKNEQKRLAIAQVFNIASSHYHVTNTFGIEIMRTTATDTIYHLGADTITKTKNHGLVPLGQGSIEAFIGSEMTIGGITHETFHEIDRRFGRLLSVPIYRDPAKQGLEWYLQNKVGRLDNDDFLGFNFGMMLEPGSSYMHLNEDSRGSDEPWNEEIFPDVAAAVVFGLHEEDFFSKADVYNPDNRIGFARYGPYVKSIICGIHQYVEQIARGATEPEQFTYDEGACEQFWSEQ